MRRINILFAVLAWTTVVLGAAVLASRAAA